MNKQTMSSKSSLGFELLDIEIIDHKKESGISNQKWNCDQCSLFFLSEDKLKEHKNKHAVIEGYLKCRYCNKTLSITEENKECYTNRKCNTCEYKCLTCPMRFQRYSSLVNHENSHLIKKKRMSTGTSKKKKQVEEIESSKQVIEELRTTTTKRKDSIDDQIFATVSPKKRKTIPVKHLDTKPVLSDTKNTVQTKDKTKRLSNSNKTHQETPRSEMKKMTKASTSTNYTNTSSNEVNYKPFSCHICSDNFASPESVLEHIKEFHGENESKGFKCKYCNDEFDDIYKMQFHLAICPLADDQPSTTLVKNIASKFHATPSTSGLQRKKGRPRKIKSENAEDQTDFNQTLPSSNRKSAKKRGKSEETSDSTETPKGSKRPRRNRKETKANIDYEDEFEYCNPDYLDKDDAEISNKEHDSKKDPLSDSFEKTPDEKEKGHTCPFPRCGIKFSREKALLSHMRNHTDDFEDVYKCHKCDIPFDDIHSLRAHLNECKCVEEENEEDESEPEYKGIQKSSKKKSRGNYTCNICGRVYQSQENLKRHLELHSSSNFICRVCKDVFLNQSLLDDHFITKHPQKSSYHCDICNEDFISELFLSIHESEYHGKPCKSTDETKTVVNKSLKKLTNSEVDDSTKKKTKRIKIPKNHGYCGIVANKRLLSGNITQSQFLCPLCYERFGQIENMREHLGTDHIYSDSIFICQVCEMEKPNADLLLYHLEMHSRNMLSVNRFSLLRATSMDNDKQLLDILANKAIKLENDDYYEIKEDSFKINNTVECNASTIRKKPKKGQFTKAIIDSESAEIKNIFDQPVTQTNVVSNELNKQKNMENMCKTKNGSLMKTRKINGREKRFAGRKTIKQEIIDDVSPKHKANNPQNNIHREKDNSDSCDEIEFIGEFETEESFEYEEDISSNNDGIVIIKHESKQKDISDSEDEINCTMCSMVFYHQDDLIDHVRTHI